MLPASTTMKGDVVVIPARLNCDALIPSPLTKTLKDCPAARGTATVESSLLIPMKAGFINAGEPESCASNETVAFDAQLSGSPALMNPAFIGINKELSTVAVPLAAGQSFRVFVSGDGIKASQFNRAGITTTSPFIVVDAG